MRGWRERILLGGILSVAAFLRLYRLDLSWFYLDQARDVVIASDIASSRHFPLLGPLMFQTEASLGPAYYYFLAIPYFFVGQPLAGAGFIALTNVAAVYLLFRFCRAFFDLTVAVVATTLFAVFPLAVLSARTIWNPGFVPLFTLLFMYALFALVVREDSRAVMALAPLLAILVQLHFTAVSLSVLVLVAVVLFRPRVRGWHAVVGLAGILALFVPYVLHELGHGFANTRAMFRFIHVDQQTSARRILPMILAETLQLLPSALRGAATEYSWSRPSLEVFSMLYRLEAVLFCGGIAVACFLLIAGRRTVEHPESSRSRPYALLLLWLWVPLLILGNKRTGSWWYYVDLLYPSQFIFIGLLLSSLHRAAVVPDRARKPLDALGAGVILSLVLAQSFFHVVLQQKVDRRGEIVFDIPRLWIGSMPPPVTTVFCLPLGYRGELMRAFVRGYGVDTPSLLASHVHGAALGHPGEGEHLNRPFVRYLASKTTDDAPGHRDADSASKTHYLVTKGRVGPDHLGLYAIQAYRPVIDYADWSFTTDGRWEKLRLPATSFGRSLASGETLRLKGTLRLPSSREGIELAVSVIGEALVPAEDPARPWKSVFGAVSLVNEPPFQVTGARVDAELIPAAARVARENSRHWIVETVFASTGLLREGIHSVDVEVLGQGRLVSLDVYEGRSLPRAAAFPKASSTNAVVSAREP